jgi:hypothetical protein
MTLPFALMLTKPLSDPIPPSEPIVCPTALSLSTPVPTVPTLYVTVIIVLFPAAAEALVGPETPEIGPLAV